MNPEIPSNTRDNELALPGLWKFVETLIGAALCSVFAYFAYGLFSLFLLLGFFPYFFLFTSKGTISHSIGIFLFNAISYPVFNGYIWFVLLLVLTYLPTINGKRPGDVITEKLQAGLKKTFFQKLWPVLSVLWLLGLLLWPVFWFTNK